VQHRRLHCGNLLQFGFEKPQVDCDCKWCLPPDFLHHLGSTKLHLAPHSGNHHCLRDLAVQEVQGRTVFQSLTAS